MQIRIKFLSGALAERSIRYDEFPVSIGSGKNDDIQIDLVGTPPPQVAVEHARILSENGQILIQDIKDGFPTFVNGARAPEGSKVALVAGDKLAFGNNNPFLVFLGRESGTTTENAAILQQQPSSVFPLMLVLITVVAIAAFQFRDYFRGTPSGGFISANSVAAIQSTPLATVKPPASSVQMPDVPVTAPHGKIAVEIEEPFTLPITSVLVENSQLTISSNDANGFDLAGVTKGDIVMVAALVGDLDNSDEAFIIPTTQWKTFFSKKTTPIAAYQLNKAEYKESDQQIFFASQIEADVPVSLVFNNSKAWWSSETYHVWIYKLRNVLFDKQKTEVMRQSQIEEMRRDYSSRFLHKDFTLRIRKCGEENAYYDPNTGNMILCTELIGSAFSDQQFSAVDFIIRHELGHLLSAQWGMPISNNEQDADELGYVFTVLVGDVGAIHQGIEFWKNKCRTTPNQEKNIDDPHQHPCQRARNFERVINGSTEVTKKWVRLLTPHMTTEYLQELNIRSENWIDHDAVQKELKYRSQPGWVYKP